MSLTLIHHDVDTAPARLLLDLERGLLQSPPTISPKWFYDEAGSELFEKITRLDEYYPTEAERSLLSVNAHAIVDAGPFDRLVELGAGVSDKTTTLLDVIVARTSGRLSYIPFDISADAITSGAAKLIERYSGIDIHGVVGDLDRHLGALPSGGRRPIAFLGGTIGNYRPAPRQRLLAAIADSMTGADRFWL